MDLFSNPLSQVYRLEHAVATHILTKMRAKETKNADFRHLSQDLALLLAMAVSQNMPLRPVSIESPVALVNNAKLLAETDVLIIPVLRAGLAMVDGFLHFFPEARVGHVGVARDEYSLEPKPYYFKVPQHEENHLCFVCDPMLATGGSIAYAIQQLKQAGISNIRLVCFVSSMLGIKRVLQAHPDVVIYTAAIDDQLNEKGYIVPGLGDAGDRFFGSE